MKNSSPIDLTLCPECETNHVHPVWWSELDGNLWHVALDCPNCGWQGEGVWDHATVLHFEISLQNALEDMRHLADRLELEASWATD